MANLTLTIDDEILRRARIRALESGTSVNALVRSYLESLTWADEETDPVRGLLSLAGASTASSGPTGRVWTRDELHERA